MTRHQKPADGLPRSPRPAPPRHRADLRALVAQILRFGVVGGFGLVIDVTVFNLLLLAVLTPGNVPGGPVLAKTASTIVAIAANWLGNRYWTFSQRRSGRSLAEAIRFGVASLVGTGVGVACLWLSHYVLHLTTVLDDNISSNVLGLLLGSAVRFPLYRSWVYRPAAAGSEQARALRRASHAGAGTAGASLIGPGPDTGRRLMA